MMQERKVKGWIDNKNIIDQTTRDNSSRSSRSNIKL